MKIAIGIFIFSSLTCANAQVIGHVNKVSKEVCYIRAGGNKKQRAIQKGDGISAGEEIFCPVNANIEVELANGQSRKYTPSLQWVIVGGVPVERKPVSPGYKPHMEMSSNDNASRATAADDSEKKNIEREIRFKASAKKRKKDSPSAVD
jgi:hypothetical protein